MRLEKKQQSRRLEKMQLKAVKQQSRRLEKTRPTPGLSGYERPGVQRDAPALLAREPPRALPLALGDTNRVPNRWGCSRRLCVYFVSENHNLNGSNTHGSRAYDFCVSSMIRPSRHLKPAPRRLCVY